MSEWPYAGCDATVQSDICFRDKQNGIDYSETNGIDHSDRNGIDENSEDCTIEYKSGKLLTKVGTCDGNSSTNKYLKMWLFR